MHVPEFCRGAPVDLLEHPEEGGQAGEAGLQRDLNHREGGVCEQRTGVVDPLLVQVFVEGGVGVLFKQPGKVIFGETGHVGGLLQRQVLGEVLLDVAGDMQEFFHIQLT